MYCNVISVSVVLCRCISSFGCSCCVVLWWLWLKLLQNPHGLLTFDKVHNPLHLPRKAHLNLQKCSVPPRFFALLTWKCASRHSGVHFFDVSTSKSGPKMVCVAHFDFEMCFAPQRRALFRHLNFQKWSDHGVLCTF